MQAHAQGCYCRGLRRCWPDLGRFKAWMLASAVVASFIASTSARAIPVFARQVQQNCVACHVGGQYPELTPYGRYFKLTGYTQGAGQVTQDGVAVPIAFSLQMGMNRMRKNSADGNPAAPAGAEIDARNGRFSPDQGSIYFGGRISDNVGLFAQYTFAFDRGNNNSGTFGADNIDLRYADHLVSPARDLIWGVSLNNNPGLTDVFNSTPAWSYPYQYSASGSATAPPVQTVIEGTYGGGTARGVNVYVSLDKSYYAEIGIYQKSSNATKLLTYTSDSEAPGHNGTVPLIGSNPYVRLAYTQEFGASNLMVGAIGLRSKIGDGSANGLATTYTDRGVDAQYQYISDPSVISAQLRYISEKISDPANLAHASPSASLRSFYAKAMYVHGAKYGAGLAYWSESGSQDAAFASADNSANLFSCIDAPACTTGSPKTKVWIPGVFWQPLQNVRLTLYQTYFTQFLGAKRNYDGYGRKAGDNNSTYLYLWMDW